MILTTDQITKLHDLAVLATPGPWGWFGQRKREYALATKHWGRRWVMRFERMGMQWAQPVFQTYEKREGDDPYHWWGRMVKADEIAVQEVPYRGDIVAIDNDDARYIAAVDPTTVLALIHEVEYLRDENKGLHEQVERLSEALVPSAELAAAFQAVRDAHAD